jgi:hypothetical protein
MKPMNENQLINLEGGKFWGWGEWECSPMGGGMCFCTRDYHAFWIDVDTDYDIKAC